MTMVRTFVEWRVARAGAHSCGCATVINLYSLLQARRQVMAVSSRRARPEGLPPNSGGGGISDSMRDSACHLAAETVGSRLSLPTIFSTSASTRCDAVVKAV